MGGRKTQAYSPFPTRYLKLRQSNPEVYTAIEEVVDFIAASRIVPSLYVSADPDVSVNNTFIGFNKLIRDTASELDLASLRWNPRFPGQPYLVTVGVRLQTALVANERMDLQIWERESGGFVENIVRSQDSLVDARRRASGSVIFYPKPGQAYWPALECSTTAPVTTINNNDGYTFFAAQYLGEVT